MMIYHWNVLLKLAIFRHIIFIVYFHRLFSSTIGESIKNYIKRLRIQRAASQLIFSKKSIAQVAEEAAYQSQQSFHYVFKEKFGMAPAAFRKLKQTELVEKKQILTDKITNNLVGELKISIVDLPETPVVFIRHVRAQSTMLDLWLKLTTYACLDQLNKIASCKKISIFHDDPSIIPEDLLRYDACISTEGMDITLEKELNTQILRGGKYAKITHYGHLENINNAFVYFYGMWLPSSHYKLADAPNLILHRVSPFDVKTGELETDIFFH